MAIETDPVGSAPTVDAYFDLVRAFPLRPIRSEGDYDRAIAAIEALADRRHHWGASEADYFLVLALLIERYEDETYPPGPDPE